MNDRSNISHIELQRTEFNPQVERRQNTISSGTFEETRYYRIRERDILFSSRVTTRLAEFSSTYATNRSNNFEP